MSINRNEFLTVKKYVTDNLLDLCLFDAIAEAIVPAYEELYGEQTIPNDPDKQREHFLRIERLSTYAAHFLIEKDPTYASHEHDDRVCRNIDQFDRVNAWSYAADFDDGSRIDVVWDCVGTWTATEYDFDGDVSHVGKGGTAQDALNAMRLIVPDDLLAE